MNPILRSTCILLVASTFCGVFAVPVIDTVEDPVLAVFSQSSNKGGIGEKQGSITDLEEKESVVVEHEEANPTTPTPCTESNKGVCACAKAPVQTYVFWPGNGSVQRCFDVYIPSSASASASVPVLVHVDGYGSGKLGQGWVKEGNYYGFATISIGSNNKDGAGGFALEFGGNGIANNTRLTPCSDSDSRDMPYLKAVFGFIATQGSLDASKVFTEGFSQSSMFAIYIAVCFADKVKGTWQGGSGLAKTGYTPIVPGKQAQCSFTSHKEHGGSCCREDFCTECQYWPLWPRTCPNKMIDCIAAYTNDPIACGSDYYMYEAMVSEGNDARLLSFKPTSSVKGGHKNPQNKVAWIVGCLGIADSCTAACSSSFVACVGSGGVEGFERCQDKIKTGELSDCAKGCAPTLTMLRTSEDPVVSLSEGRFGGETNLAKAGSQASRPNCNFGRFGERNQCGVDMSKRPSGNPPPPPTDCATPSAPPVRPPTPVPPPVTPPVAPPVPPPVTPPVAPPVTPPVAPPVPPPMGSHCSAACSKEFVEGCIPHMKQYSKCRKALDKGKGALKGLCKRGCSDTSDMAAAKAAYPDKQKKKGTEE